MMHLMTEEEVKESHERVRHLYQSKWIQDNITAILMDTSVGETGDSESNARVKAHRIIDSVEFKKQYEVS